MNKVEHRRKSSGSSRRRKSGDKKSITDSVKNDIQSTIQEESLQEETHSSEPVKINYQNEVVFIFFNHMLDQIIDEWVTIPDTPICECKDNTKDINTLSTIDSRFRESVDIVSVPELSTSSRRRSSKRSLNSSSRRRDSKSSTHTKRDSADHQRHKLSLKRVSNTSALKSGARRSSINTPDEESVVVPSSHSLDWMVNAPDENVIIKFKNGNRYEGPVSKKVMHGYGIFKWADGAVYEGDFVRGNATGKGTLRYPDLSLYNGEFCNNRLNGQGVVNINSTSMIYSGQWKSSEKHGRGWLLYESGNMYDGEWKEDERHGVGLRHYKTGEKYKGCWSEGKREGQGTILWPNNDFYKGGWLLGEMHGYGEYTWKAFLNRSLTYPIQNVYRGSWSRGKRDGVGLLNFGTDSGARLAGLWSENEKHGAGVLICDNGLIIERNPLFWHDKPIHMEAELGQLYCSDIEDNTSYLSRLSITSSNFLKSNFRLISTQVCSKQPSKTLNAHILHSINKTLNNKSYIYNAYPKSIECSPLPIPVLSPPEHINLSHLIHLCVVKYVGDLYKNDCINAITNGPEITAADNNGLKYTKWNLSGDIVKESNTSLDSGIKPRSSDMASCIGAYAAMQTETELKYIRHSFLQHLPKLHKLYHKYATIASPEVIPFETVLIRLFFWQMLRELPAFNRRYSLHELDKILFENIETGLETEHDPFEEIYFWQFLQILLTLAWVTHSPDDISSKCKRFGILANIFDDFVTNVLEQDTEIVSGCSLFACRDVVPMHAVYLLYRSLGEPHTARKFLCNICVKKGTQPPCHLRAFDKEVIPKLAKGSNCIAVGGNLIYLPDDPPNFGEVPDDEAEFPQSDPFRKELFALRSLGPRKVVQCLMKVCPQIAEDGVVVNMEYPLSFIEFYDALLMCTYMVVDKMKKREERLRLIEQRRLLEEALLAENASKSTIGSKVLKESKRKKSKSIDTVFALIK